MRDCRSTSSVTRSPMARSASLGRRPSAERVRRPASTWSLSPATRTWKNSSRPSEKMARNLTRSSSGHPLVVGELEEPGPEFEPRQLPVGEALRAARGDGVLHPDRGECRRRFTRREARGERPCWRHAPDSEACIKHPGYRRWLPAQGLQVPGSGTGPAVGSTRCPDSSVASRPPRGCGSVDPSPSGEPSSGCSSSARSSSWPPTSSPRSGTTSKIPANLGPVPGRRARARPGRAHRQPDLRPRRQRRAPAHRHVAERARAT